MRRVWKVDRLKLCNSGSLFTLSKTLSIVGGSFSKKKSMHLGTNCTFNKFSTFPNTVLGLFLFLPGVHQNTSFFKFFAYIFNTPYRNTSQLSSFFIISFTKTSGFICINLEKTFKMIRLASHVRGFPLGFLLYNEIRQSLWPSFLVEIFSGGFPSTIRPMSGNLGHICPQTPFGHHNHPNHFSSVYGWRRSLASAAVCGHR